MNTKIVAMIFAMLMTLTAFASVELTRNTNESKTNDRLGSRFASPAAIDLGTAANFTILSKSGISTTGVTHITGDIGVSPAAATYITGFGLVMAGNHSTSSLVTGNVYAANYPVPTPAIMTTAIGDMQTAYTTAAGRPTPDATELYTGSLAGHTLEPGLYKWSSNVWINATGVTLNGSAADVIIFQIAQNLIVANGAQVTLTGGLLASNVFWQVGAQATIGTTAVMKGNILASTAIVMSTGATLEGKALAQTAVTLDGNIVTPSGVAPPVVHVLAGGLQAAINASSNGNIIYFANGTNNITDAQGGFIYVNKNLTFVGSGSAVLNVTGVHMVFNNTTAIHNLELTKGHYFINQSKILTVENCNFTGGNVESSVIQMDNLATLNFFNSTMYVPTLGTGITGLDEDFNTINILGSHFLGNGTNLVYTMGSADVTVTNTTFVGAPDEYAIYTDGSDSTMTLTGVSAPIMNVGMAHTGNTFTMDKSNIRDIYITAADSVTITNSTIDPLHIGSGDVLLVNVTFNPENGTTCVDLGSLVDSISVINCTFNMANNSIGIESDSAVDTHINDTTFNLVNNSTAIVLTAEVNLYVSNVTWNDGAHNSHHLNVTGMGVSIAYYGDSPKDFAYVAIGFETGSDVTFYLDFFVQVAGAVTVYLNSTLTTNIVNRTCDASGYANFTDVAYGMVNETGYYNTTYIFMFSAPSYIADVLTVTITDLERDVPVAAWLNSGNRQVMWMATLSDYRALWSGYTVALDFAIGTATFCYPLIDSVLASEFLALHPGIAWISQYNSTSSSFETYYLSGFGTNFEMVFGSGYILGCSGSGSINYSHSEMYIGGSYSIAYGSSFHGNPYMFTYTVGDFFANSHVAWIGLRTGDRYTYYYPTDAMSTPVDPLAVAYIGSNDDSVLVLGDSM